MCTYTLYNIYRERERGNVYEFISDTLFCSVYLFAYFCLIICFRLLCWTHMKLPLLYIKIVDYQQ